MRTSSIWAKNNRGLHFWTTCNKHTRTRTRAHTATHTHSHKSIHKQLRSCGYIFRGNCEPYWQAYRLHSDLIERHSDTQSLVHGHHAVKHAITCRRIGVDFGGSPVARPQFLHFAIQKFGFGPKIFTRLVYASVWTPCSREWVNNKSPVERLKVS